MPQVSERVADLLDVLRTRATALSASEIAAGLGVSGPACQRLLASALDSGFIVHEGDPARYRLSPRLWGWAVAATHSEHQIIEAVRPGLIEAARSIDETLLLSLPKGRDVLFMEAATQRHDVVIIEPVASVVPAHACAPGKVLLAQRDAADLDEYLAEALVGFTETTITDPGALRAELEHVRSAGYAVSRGEHGEHAAIEVPFLDAHGAAVAAISVTGAATVDGVRRLESLALVLRRLAGGLSEALGYEQLVGRAARVGYP